MNILVYMCGMEVLVTYIFFCYRKYYGSEETADVLNLRAKTATVYCVFPGECASAVPWAYFD